jgi:uncharacterized membrane protein YfcA
MVAEVVLVLVLATLVRAVVGFGDALLAMPLLTLLVGVRVATPLVGLTGGTLALAMVTVSWRHLDLRAVGGLLAAAVAGVPVGVLLLVRLPEDVLRAVIGVLVVAYALYRLARLPLPLLRSPWWVAPFGFGAGALGAAGNVSGPPLVLYASLRRYPPARLRATLQGYFLGSSLLIVAGHGIAGLWTAQVWRLYALAMPAMFVALAVGGALGRRLPARRFERVLDLVLLAVGTLLLLVGP